MKKVLLAMFAHLPVLAWGQTEPVDMIDGYVLTTETVEGVEMTFQVISQEEKA